MSGGNGGVGGGRGPQGRANPNQKRSSMSSSLGIDAAAMAAGAGLSEAPSVGSHESGIDPAKVGMRKRRPGRFGGLGLGAAKVASMGGTDPGGTLG